MALAATLAIVLVPAFVSCARPPETDAPAAAAAEVRPGIAIPSSGTLVLTTTPEGLFSPMSGGSPAQVQSQPFAVAVAPAAIQPLGDSALVAVNRSGLVRLSVKRYGGATGQAGQTQGGQKETRVLVEALPGAGEEFAGRTVASSWADRGSALFLLHRHPMFETDEPKDPPSVLVEGTVEAARLYMGTGWAANEWCDAYAVYPARNDAWIVQYRSEDGERVLTRYATVFSDGRPATDMKRQDFERSVLPVNLAKADALLEQAAAAVEGPVLVEVRFEDGTRSAWLRGDLGEATPAWAYVGNVPGGGRVAVLATDDWRVVVAHSTADVAGSPNVKALFPPAALPGARVRDAALVGGLAVLLWEEDLFPDIGASGLVVIDLALDTASAD